MSITSFEGETETTIMFQYGKDFFNGDIVQIANEYGHETKLVFLKLFAQKIRTAIPSIRLLRL